MTLRVCVNASGEPLVPTFSGSGRSCGLTWKTDEKSGFSVTESPETFILRGPADAELVPYGGKRIDQMPDIGV